MDGHSYNRSPLVVRYLAARRRPPSTPSGHWKRLLMSPSA